jgi:integrase
MEEKRKRGRPVGTVKNSEGLYLTEEQLQTFFKEIRKSKDKKYGLIFNLAVYFGMRVGEICKMKINDVFLGKSSNDLTVSISGLKNGRTRCYERIDHKLAFELAKWIKGRTDGNPYLFPSRVVEDGQSINAQSIKNRFKFYVKKIGLPKTFSVHNLRATTATRMVQQKFGIMEVTRWLRLRSVSNCQKYFDRDENKQSETKVRDMFGSYL